MILSEPVVNVLGLCVRRCDLDRVIISARIRRAGVASFACVGAPPSVPTRPRERRQRRSPQRLVRHPPAIINRALPISPIRFKASLLILLQGGDDDLPVTEPDAVLPFRVASVVVAQTTRSIGLLSAAVPPW